MDASSPVAPPAGVVNVAAHLVAAAAAHPHRRAVVAPAGRDRAGRAAYSQLTFAQLDRESDRLAHGLVRAGIGRGVRTVLMVRPGIEFFEIIFALFKAGAVPVVVDPGMGVRRMLACYRSAGAEAFIGIPLAQAVRTLFRSAFRGVRAVVTVGRRWFWGGATLAGLRRGGDPHFPLAPTGPGETAAVLFTTGATGPAKGAIYTHGNFDAQLAQIRTHLDFEADEVDLSTFPLFALFYPALGVTAVVPDMDPTRPARANPERLIEAIRDQGVTNMFASPALLERLSAYGTGRGLVLPSLRRVISAGAPVQAATIERMQGLLEPGAEIHTPYGATEAVPVASILGREILAETRAMTDRGYGICVGRPINDIPVRIIAVTDDPIARWSDDLALPAGEIGEIAVKGALVSPGYVNNSAADALAKIPEGNTFWHRMGDLGWMDRKGRIWFCGRKSHRVITAAGTLYTIPCEAVFNTHPAVFRSALVGIGPRSRQVPAVCIELAPAGRKAPRRALLKELLELAARNDLTRDIRIVLFHRRFPVDIRHNAKIFREELARWAARKVRPAALARAAAAGEAG
jgi:acyl-CoA synthetase (AMP-forming)/AMP-acid ligase II